VDALAGGSSRLLIEYTFPHCGTIAKGLPMTITLSALLKDSAYRLDQFKPTQIATLEAAITLKESGKKEVPYITCLVRGKSIKLTPEEAVRQLYVMVLRDDLGYPVARMELEYAVSFGREKKRADICLFDKDKTTAPYLLVELKKPKLKDGKEQLKSYCNATGAPMGVWTNGQQISYYHRKDPNYFEDIPAIPSVREKLSDILAERWTIADLVKRDKLVNERKSLKDLILEMEDEVLANAGVDVFEELFKLVFTKLYDEMEGGRDKKRHLVFKNYGDTETELKAKIQDLFDKARAKWEGVFPDGAKIDLTPSHLAVCVASLEKVKLFNSNLEVVDEAFEYLINKSSKGEKGQYFTPRYVIDLCVRMMNPQEHETLIDTAAGSCGFPVHGIFHVWEQIMKEEGLAKSHLFTTEKKPARCEDYVRNKVFAIDFDEKAVRVGRTLNLIAGDGQTNVLHLNTLDYERWHEKTDDDETWRDIYGEGWKKLRKLRADKAGNRDFGFDVLMANPPFAGDIKETRILSKYELGKKPDGKHQSAVGRDILFIERNLCFLKPGGRMAVVLPQGRFNNASDKRIRDYLAEHCRILAVVGLHGNVFKPHTGTKTSVLFVQKWNDDAAAGPLCPRRDDYPIFFATMREPSKDTSGDKIFVKRKDVAGWARAAEKPPANLAAEAVDRYDASPQDLDAFALDTHGHLVVKHDLFSHELQDGQRTPDGIAEAFIEFAKKEGLSFFR
jgi:type I restriction enzyme M protein